MGIIITSAVVGLFSGAGAGVAQFKNGGWPAVFRAAVIGTFVAVIVGLGISSYIANETIKLAIVGACAAIGEDIFEGLKTFGRGIRKDPLGYLSRVFDALRGNPRDGRDTTRGDIK